MKIPLRWKEIRAALYLDGKYTHITQDIMSLSIITLYIIFSFPLYQVLNPPKANAAAAHSPAENFLPTL